MRTFRLEPGCRIGECVTSVKTKPVCIAFSNVRSVTAKISVILANKRKSPTRGNYLYGSAQGPPNAKMGSSTRRDLAPTGRRRPTSCPSNFVIRGNRSPIRYEARFFEMVSRYERPWFMDQESKGSVLLVEDDDQVRSFIRMLLTNHGYRVLEAQTGAEGLAIATNESRNIDLLLSDMLLPELSGFDLAQKTLELKPEMKVLFMTGYVEGDIVQRDRRTWSLVSRQTLSTEHASDQGSASDIVTTQLDRSVSSGPKSVRLQSATSKRSRAYRKLSSRSAFELLGSQDHSLWGRLPGLSTEHCR